MSTRLSRRARKIVRVLRKKELKALTKLGLTRLCDACGGVGRARHGTRCAACEGTGRQEAP